MTNGGVVAAGLQLTPDDTCYSGMPPFHIGGIGASILCILASGGIVCCDDAPYDAGRRVAALATSNPQPTWHAVVPGIIHATVACAGGPRAGGSLRW